MGKSVNIASPDITILSSLLGDNKTYYIPLFQRNYSWLEKHCKELYEDIIEGFIKNKSHFIGIFMYYNVGPVTSNEQKNILIDGQQRLTTIMLLLCAIRDVTNDEKLVDSISCFIKNSNEKIGKFKLKQNNNDDLYFQNIMEGKIEKTTDKSFIYKNYSYFVNLLTEEKRVKDFFSLFEYIKTLESVEIILDNNNINNVQKIFEKINSSGEPLKQADLVRNFVLFTPDEKEQENLYKIWCCIEQIVGKDMIAKFVRAYTIRYIYSIVNIDDVYVTFKEKFEGYKKYDILKDMLIYAKYYSIIESNTYYEVDKDYNIISHVEGRHYNDNTLRMLKALRTDDLIPLIMQVYSKIFKGVNNNENLRKILDLILDFMIRYRIVKPSAGGGSLDVRIYRIINKIDSGEVKITFNSIYEELSRYEKDTTNYPTNTAFLEKMRTDMNQKDGRVLLFQYARRTQAEINNIVFDSNVELEHFMPQTIEKGNEDGDWWIKNLGENDYNETRRMYTDVIGNYGLLMRDTNSSASNYSWPKKSHIISKRGIDKLTLKVADLVNWNKDSIINRNKDISNIIMHVITGPKSEDMKTYSWLTKSYKVDLKKVEK